ncbi:MAG: protein O-GlcNAcase [Actinomycetes bacterium]
MTQKIALVGSDWDDDLRGWASRAGLIPVVDVASADVVVTVRINAAELTVVGLDGFTQAQRDARFRLDSADGSSSRLQLTAASAQGRRLGLNAVARALRHGSWDSPETQVPKFAQRGVLEGFYGPPWSHAQRLDMVDFLADHDFNMLLLAPKDDASQRWDWREALDDVSLNRIGEIVARGAAAGVEVACCVSPGLSIHYSDSAEVDLLIKRLQQFYAVGVRRFGLLLDDIPEQFHYADDQAAFRSMAQAHAALASEVGRRLWALDPAVALALCPLVYHGMGDEPYLVELGRALHPRIDLFWTGRDICSQRLDLLDAATFIRSTWRPPLFWDNYPVNDVAMVGELHVGPLRGRDRHLYRLSAGLLANGMDRAEASKIAFATIGDYLRDPEGYDPDVSWLRAIREVAGPLDHEAFARFAENVLVSCLAVDDAPTLTSVLAKGWFRLESGDRVGARTVLLDFADLITSTAAWLLRPDSNNPVLIADCEPWIREYARGADALRDIVRVIDGDADAPLLRELLRGYTHSATIATSPRVFADSLSMFIDDLLARP